MSHKPMNLSHISLSVVPIVAKQNKKDACEIAKSKGFYLDDVRPAYNRFWRFWIIGQWIEPYSSIRVLCDDGTTTLITLKQPLY